MFGGAKYKSPELVRVRVFVDVTNNIVVNFDFNNFNDFVKRIPETTHELGWVFVVDAVEEMVDSGDPRVAGCEAECQSRYLA